MYNIKDKFDLLVKIDNVSNISLNEIDRMKIERGIEKLYPLIVGISHRSNHFSKIILNNAIKDKSFNVKQKIVPVLYEDYKMAVIYNYKNDKVLINISYYNMDDIYGGKPDPRSLYSCLIYGIVLRSMYNKKQHINEDFSGPIIAFLNTVVLSIFGKQYGLIGAYSYRIPILKYLTACYVLSSYFGVKGNELFEKAKKHANVNFREEIDKLEKYDFFNITEYIKALSESNVMRGFTTHEFTFKLYRFLGIHFLAAMEDFSRFMALMTISEIPGNSFIPFSLKKYNRREYLNIVNTCKKLFT